MWSSSLDHHHHRVFQWSYVNAMSRFRYTQLYTIGGDQAYLVAAVCVWNSLQTVKHSSTQPSIPPGSVDRVSALLAGVKAGCARLCRAASEIVWHRTSVTTRSSEMARHEEFIRLFTCLPKHITRALPPSLSSFWSLASLKIDAWLEFNGFLSMQVMPG